MPRSPFSTRPRASYGVHRFRNVRLDYAGEYVSGLHVLIDLRRLGMNDHDILPLLERLERRTVHRKLLASPPATQRLQ